MRWSDVIDTIADVVGFDIAEKIEARIRLMHGGERVTINKLPIITSEKVTNTAPGKPKLAARKLGIHPSTAYRAIHRARTIR